MSKDKKFPTKSEVDKLVEDFCEPAEGSFLLGCLKADPSEMVDIEIIKGGKSIGADIHKNGITYPDSIDTKKHFFRQFMNDEISCDEYHRLVDDEGILRWKPSGKRNELFDRESFAKAVLSSLDEATLSNLKNIKRYSFKKKENLLLKVVKWWKK